MVGLKKNKRSLRNYIEYKMLNKWLCDKENTRFFFPTNILNGTQERAIQTRIVVTGYLADWPISWKSMSMTMVDLWYMLDYYELKDTKIKDKLQFHFAKWHLMQGLNESKRN